MTFEHIIRNDIFSTPENFAVTLAISFIFSLWAEIASTQNSLKTNAKPSEL